jgi:GTP-binding protein LepA
LEDIIHASVKLVLVENILAAIIEKFHHHQEVDEPLQALIFDSHYNPFRGIE